MSNLLALTLERKGSLMEFFRWSSSFAFVIGVHAVIILIALYWTTASSPVAAQPMASIMIDLAPMPAAPEVPANALTPGPVQKETPPPKPERVPEPEIEPLPEVPDVKNPEAIIPVKPDVEEEEAEEEQEQDEEEAADEDKAPPAIEAPPAEKMLAPKQGAFSLVPSHVKATWQSVLLGHLERHKRYPRKARRNRQEAVVTVRVRINRDGSVVSYQLEQPSAYDALNKETLALIKRAEPLPPPPPEMDGDTIEFVVPVVFTLRR